MIPGYGGTQRLAQIIGKGKAMEMVLTAGMIDAESALRFGLVNQVVDQEMLMETAQIMANKIAKNAPTALSAALESMLAGYSRDGFEVEIERFGHCFTTQDFKEGTGIPRKTQATISRIMSEIDIATAVVVPVVANTPHALPEYGTEDSAGLDLRAKLDAPVVLQPGQRALIPTGLHLALPRGYEAQVRPRSGLAYKHGVTVLNSPGTIDAQIIEVTWASF